MRKAVKTILIVILGLAVLAPSLYYGGIWFFVTQPILYVERTDKQYEADPSVLEEHVRYLSESCFPRNYAYPEQIERAADYIHSQFEQTKGLVEDQKYTVEGIEYRNIIVRFGPDNGKRIIVGAHYDVYEAFPGANDDASGIAALIELAYLLDKTELPVTVELVAFTLEEPPFYNTDEMGSAVHAKSLKDAGVDVKMMVTLDEIGYYSDEPGSQTLPVYKWLKNSYSETANFIAILGPLNTWYLVRRVKAAMASHMEMPVYSFNAPVEMEPGMTMGDHRNYIRYGYPGIIITDTAFLRSNIKHSEFDTADTLDYVKISQIVAGLYYAVLTMAGL